jgi:hypothetical protein
MAGSMPPNTQAEDAASLACLEAWAALVVGLPLLLFTPSVQPIKPVAASFPGMIAAVGFAATISAFRFGSWGTRIVAVCAGCCHVLLLLAVGHELYQAW